MAGPLARLSRAGLSLGWLDYGGPYRIRVSRVYLGGARSAKRLLLAAEGMERLLLGGDMTGSGSATAVAGGSAGGAFWGRSGVN